MYKIIFKYNFTRMYYFQTFVAFVKPYRSVNHKQMELTVHQVLDLSICSFLEVEVRGISLFPFLFSDLFITWLERGSSGLRNNKKVLCHLENQVFIRRKQTTFNDDRFRLMMNKISCQRFTKQNINAYHIYQKLIFQINIKT